MLNNFDVAGILTTYAKHCGNARDTEKLRDFVRKLKAELDLRKIKILDEGQEE